MCPLGREVSQITNIFKYFDIIQITGLWREQNTKVLPKEYEAKKVLPKEYEANNTLTNKIGALLL